MITNSGIEKRCPRCGAAFVCTHDAHCQCVGVKLDEKARAYLRTHYEDCLCRKCLENLSLRDFYDRPQDARSSRALHPSREGIEESEESESV